MANSSDQLVKYPRTHHFPFSEGDTSDDVWWDDCKNFEGREVVVTSKLDGENTNLYRNSYHARSLDYSPHSSRDWLRSFHRNFAHEIPEGMRICGENLYGFHSIFYEDLTTYFYVFGIYEGDRCLSWDDTVEWCKLLSLETVPVLYRGVWDESLIRNLPNRPFKTHYATKDHPKWPEDFKPCDSEGYVVRVVESFGYDDFTKCCAKYVSGAFRGVMRKIHWRTAIVVPNLLKKGSSHV
jgi:hypothetical protein